MLCYWDTSALLPLLFSEPQTARIRSFVSRKKGLPGVTSFFTFYEMESAFFRRLEEGSISQADLSRLRLQAQKLEEAVSIIWPDAEILSLGRRFVSEFGLRPGDALQLSSSSVLLKSEKEVSFVSLDKKLNEAAEAVGLNLPL